MLDKGWVNTLNVIKKLNLISEYRDIEHCMEEAILNINEKYQEKPITYITNQAEYYIDQGLDLITNIYDNPSEYFDFIA